MKYIKRFNESVNHLSDDIYDWTVSELGSKDCKVKKISSSDNKLEMEIDYESPVVVDGYYDRTYATINIDITDYADDYDYAIKINGEFGEFGSSKYDKNKKSWRKSKNISVEDNELTYTELKKFIKTNINKYI